MTKNRSQRRNQLRYSKLENRHLLAADFSLSGGVLTLDAFENSVAVDPNNLIVQQTGAETLSFTLTDGTWSGVSVLGATASDAVLTVNTSVVNEIFVNSTTNDQFSIEFGNFEFFGNFLIDNDGGAGALFESVTQQEDTRIDFSNVTNGFSQAFVITGAETIALQNPANDFSEIEIDNVTTASIVSGSNLTVLSASASDQLQLAAGALDQTPASGSEGELILEGDITAGNQLLLQASDGVTQGAGGIITTDQLLLGGNAETESSGVFLLDQANQVNEIAFAPQLMFEQNFIPPDFVDPANDLGLFESGSDITIDTFTSQGDPELTLFDNQGFVLAQNDDLNLSVSLDALVSVPGLPDGAYVVAISGFITTFGDGFMVQGGTSSGPFTLNITGDAGGNLTQNQVTGNLNPNEVIFYSFTIGEAAEPVINPNSSLVFNNNQDVSIVETTFNNAFAGENSESFTGLFVGGNLDLNVTGSILQTDGSIIVGNSADLTATNDIDLGGVDADGDGFEDNSFGAIDPNLDAGGNILFATSGDLLTPTLDADGTITLVADGDLTLTPEFVVDGGNLQFIADRITIETDIVADTLFLQASNGVELVDTFVVDVNNLSLAGAGNFDFVTGPGIDNVIDNLSTDIAGSLDLESASNLSLSTLTVEVGASTLVDSGTALTGNLNLSAENITSANTSSDIVAGNVSLNASGLVSLDNLTSTSGDVNISADGPTIVSTIDAFDNVTVNAVGDITVSTIESSFGTVFLNALDGVDVGEIIAEDNVTIGAALQGVDLGRVVSSTGSVLVSAGSNNLIAQEVEAAVDVTLDAAAGNLITSAVSAGNVAELTAAGNQTALQLDADTGILTAGIDLRVNDIQADDLTLSAGDDIRDVQFGDGLGVTTDSLVVTAGNSINEVTSGGIILETNVDFLSATVEGDAFGNVIIREADGLALGVIDVGDGRVAITAGGTINGGNIQTRVQAEPNDVRLIANGDGSDILVNQINVGDVAGVFLTADDDVVSTSENQITAENLFVRANNRSAGGTNGISLSTDVDNAILIVGDIADENQNSGDISITDEGMLVVDFARTLAGSVSVTTGANLVASNVQAEGVTQADSISLTALGSGSDVVTGRVVVRNQTGGIELIATDDVRDSNLQDNLETIANNLTVFAGNNLSDGFNGINLQSRVRSFSGTVASGDAAILLDNTGLLAVNQANLSSGFVRFNNLVGSVQIDNVNFSSSSSDNRVFVNTFGENADILVGSIDAEGGNVLLDSADDIFDTNLLDDLFIEGVFLLATSRNGNIGPSDGIFLEADVDSFFADAQLGGQEFIRQPA